MCKREFIIAQYFFSSGQPSAPLPTAAPCGGDRRPCDIRKHDLRNRTTGPEHPLIIIKCLTHNSYFTLYPPGFYPHGRKPVTPDDGDNDDSSETSFHTPWTDSLFKAAIEAASGKPAWTRFADHTPSWTTQCRQIRTAGRWLGLEGERSEECMMALGVELRLHQQARRDFQRGGFRRQGRAIQKVLEAMDTLGGRLLCLLRSGYRAGLCGRPWRCLPSTGLQPMLT